MLLLTANLINAYLMWGHEASNASYCCGKQAWDLDKWEAVSMEAVSHIRVSVTGDQPISTGCMKWSAPAAATEMLSNTCSACSLSTAAPLGS